MPIPGLALPDERIWDALNGVMPAWGLLALAPRWRWTMPLVTATAAFYSLLYCATMAGSMLCELPGVPQAPAPLRRRAWLLATAPGVKPPRPPPGRAPGLLPALPHKPRCC